MAGTANQNNQNYQIVGGNELSTNGGQQNRKMVSNSQGAVNRSERANIVQAAKLASGGKKLNAKEKKRIEKQARAKIKAENAGLLKEQVEQKLKELVAEKGLGKLATKTTLRNGKNNTLRASQITLAVEV